MLGIRYIMNEVKEVERVLLQRFITAYYCYKFTKRKILGRRDVYGQ